MLTEILPYLAITGFALFVFFSSNTWRLQTTSKPPLLKIDGQFHVGPSDGVLHHKLKLERKHKNGELLTVSEHSTLYGDDSSIQQIEKNYL